LDSGEANTIAGRNVSSTGEIEVTRILAGDFSILKISALGIYGEGARITKIELLTDVYESSGSSSITISGFGYTYSGDIALAPSIYPFKWRISRNAANLVQCYYKQDGVSAWQLCPESFTDADPLMLSFLGIDDTTFSLMDIKFNWYAMSQWVSMATDSWFDVGTGTWTGTGWAPDAGTVNLSVKAMLGIAWELNFRPTYIRVTFSGAPTIDLKVKDGSGNILADLTYESGAIASLDFRPIDSGVDLLSIEMYDAALTEVTNIEFFCEDTGFPLEYKVLMESGDGILLETGDNLLKE
jgi:hypothetical protein